ncbi:hypothetical protein BN1110_03918 [bacterium YEK0313]|nr:hypothetical protein BN1110_03918 [bacterium YEK0313]
MTYLATTLWPWLAAAGLLGVLVGAATARGRRPVAVRRGGLVLDLVAWSVAALLSVGIAAAILHWVDGRHGLWLDMALAMTGLYVLGCAIGAVLRRVATGAPAGTEATSERAAGKPAAEERPVQPVTAAALPPAEASEMPAQADAAPRPDGASAPAEPLAPEPAREKADAGASAAGSSEDRKTKAGKAKSRQPAGGKARTRTAKPAKAPADAGPSDLPADAAAPAARPRRPRGKAAGEGTSGNRPRGKPKS